MSDTKREEAMLSLLLRIAAWDHRPDGWRKEILEVVTQADERLVVLQHVDDPDGSEHDID